MYWVFNEGESRLVHDSATYPICFSCRGKSPILTTLSLRGLCLESQFDRNYILATDDSALLFYQGDRHTNITFSDGRWRMTATRTREGSNERGTPVSATSGSERNSLLLGRHQFLFESDAQCTSQRNFLQWVVLTSCKENEFTCRDGSCIRMERRCDKIIHCPNDSSDEEECVMVLFPATYRQEFAPVEVAEDGQIIRTEVMVAIELLKILKIKEVDNLFSCQLRLLLSWKDQRLEFADLKVTQEQNTLSQAEVEQLWTPLVVFANTEERTGVVKDARASAIIKKVGDAKVADGDHIDNTFLSTGADNPITLQRTYKGDNLDPYVVTVKIDFDFVAVDFICIFELAWYPFDTQNCFMNLTLDSSIFVMLAPNDVVYLGEVDLAQYYVKNTTMDADDDFVVVKVTLGRRILSSLLTVYVPTLLLNIIALSTNYFKVLLTPHIYKPPHFWTRRISSLRPLLPSTCRPSWFLPQCLLEVGKTVLS